MLRTSRKWKNAVRYQAAQVFPAEWKVFTARAGLAPVPATSTPTFIQLTTPIPQGLDTGNRIGNRVKVRRVDVWIQVSPSAGDHPEPETAVRATLIQQREDRVIPADLTSDYDYGAGGSFNWARGWCVRLIERNNEPNFYILDDKRKILAGIGAHQHDGATNYLATVPSDLSASGATSLKVVREGAHNLNHPGYTGVVATYLGNEAPSLQVTTNVQHNHDVPAHVIAVGAHDTTLALQTNQLKRRDWKARMVLRKAWSRGLDVTYSSGNPLTDLGSNQHLVFCVVADQVGALSYEYFFRVWYTDA